MGEKVPKADEGVARFRFRAIWTALILNSQFAIRTLVRLGLIQVVAGHLHPIRITAAPSRVTCPVRARSLTRMILQPLAVAIVLAFAVRSLVRVYAIPSASMHPTLHVGDHIVVVHDAHPVRGEVVVFRSPGSRDELMVKRIVAEPGDLVATSNGRLTVGSHALAEPYVAEATASVAIVPQIVPAGCYFVLGDNRANSYDSRNWGVLPRELVVGRAVMVLWSSGDGGSEPQANATTVAPAPLARGIRLERLFKLIR